MRTAIVVAAVSLATLVIGAAVIIGPPADDTAIQTCVEESVL